jgi:hypothetical protein
MLMLADDAAAGKQQQQQLQDLLHLQWAKGIKKNMHWVYGTTDIDPKYQMGETPLHRAARIVSQARSCLTVPSMLLLQLQLQTEFMAA